MRYPGVQSGIGAADGSGVLCGETAADLRRLRDRAIRSWWAPVSVLLGLLASFGSLPLKAQNMPNAPTHMGGIVQQNTCGGLVSIFCDPNTSRANDGFGNLASMPLGDPSGITNTESCNSWTEAAVHSPTVSATRLEVPAKASSEYQKACGAFKDKRFSTAEDAVRKAIGLDPNYAAAWVVLGQVLDAQNKKDDARKACSQAMSVDPTYVPPYICLADFAAKENNWDEVSRLSTRALELDPVSNVYAFYFTAAAEFHLHQILKAETDAMSVVRLDIWHRLPQIHRLLAKIYEIKGDSHSEEAQLKEYLKQSPNSDDSAQMRSLLAQLEAAPNQPPQPAK